MGCGFGEEVEAAGDEDEVGGVGVGEGGLFGCCGGGVHVLLNGRIVEEGGSELIEKIDREGFGFLKQD